MNDLRAIVLDRRVQAYWSEALPIVQRIFNATKNDSTGLSPTQILFGNAINTERGLFATSDSSQHSSSLQLAGWVDNMLKAQAEILQIAHTNQLKSDIEHIAPSPKRSKKPSVKQSPITEFPIGDYVLVSYPENAVTGRRPPNKLMAQLKGPYKVVNSVGSAMTIQNLVTNKLETVHITQLHPFHFNAHETDPRTIANVDAAAWDVESIITHKGKMHQKGSLSFKVRWAGYGPEDDTWEPWKNLRNTEAMHTYLRAKNLAQHIPKSILQPEDA
jgi:hypothetical protein